MHQIAPEAKKALLENAPFIEFSDGQSRFKFNAVRITRVSGSEFEVQLMFDELPIWRHRHELNVNDVLILFGIDGSVGVVLD